MRVLDLYSVLALPALLIIFLTALFGLNDVRMRAALVLHTLHGWVELGLGVSFMAMALSSLLLTVGVLGGAPIYTWRGCLFVWGVAGVFGLVGRFAPWRNWIQRLADAEPAQ